MTTDYTANVSEWTDEELEQIERDFVRASELLAQKGARTPIESLRQLDKIREERARRASAKPRPQR